MLAPELVEVFVAEYQAEYAKRTVDALRQRRTAERRVVDANARIDRFVAALGSAARGFAEIQDALVKARTDRDIALAEVQEQDALPIVALHPAIAADYRRQAVRLQSALADPDANQEAASALRSLIDRIVKRPTPTAGVSSWR